MKRLLTALPLALLLAAPASAVTLDMSFANLDFPHGTDAPASQSCTHPGSLAAPVCAPLR